MSPEAKKEAPPAEKKEEKKVQQKEVSLYQFAGSVVNELQLKLNEVNGKYLEAKRLRGLVGSAGGVLGHDKDGKEIIVNDKNLKAALSKLLD